MQAVPGTSSEMLSVLRSEHTADRVQTLGACEGMEGSETASAAAFRALQEGQQEAGGAKVPSWFSSLHAHACLQEGSEHAILGLQSSVLHMLADVWTNLSKRCCAKR